MQTTHLKQRIETAKLSMNIIAELERTLKTLPAEQRNTVLQDIRDAIQFNGAIHAYTATLDKDNLSIRKASPLEVEIIKPVKKAPVTNTVGTSQMVLDYVRAHPNCLQREVVNALENVITTTSKKRRDIIYQAIFSLASRQGKLKRGKEGRLVLA